MARPVTLTDATFRTTVIEAERPVLVDFWADWNSTCKALAPSIARLAEEYEGRAVIGKLDVDSNPQTAGLFAVMSVPTVMLFRNGTAVNRIPGYRPFDVLRAELDALLMGV